MKHGTSFRGALEHAVLLALWDLGRASVRQIHSRVGEPGGLAYTTTATVLDRLYLKGAVSRKRVGKALVYRPKIERETIERARARQSLRQLLGADPRPAIAALVEAADEIDPELVEELARAIQAHRRGRRGS